MCCICGTKVSNKRRRLYIKATPFIFYGAAATRASARQPRRKPTLYISDVAGDAFLKKEWAVFFGMLPCGQAAAHVIPTHKYPPFIFREKMNA